MKILVLGAAGMLGNAVFNYFHKSGIFDVWGTLRTPYGLNFFPQEAQSKLIPAVDALNMDSLCTVLNQVRPDLVINCIGLIKQLTCANDPLMLLPINAMFPHRLAKLCALINARLVHISTDCVFNGRKGLYIESDQSDAEDLYGKSKFIGELSNLSHAITLRTSIIGHELNSKLALIEWFLSQKGSVKGYVNAIFSGLPTVELARVIHDYVIPNPALFGLYHIASEPINKYDLLTLVAEIYGKEIALCADDQVIINRSLNAERFKAATGYVAPKWPTLISLMHDIRQN